MDRPTAPAYLDADAQEWAQRAEIHRTVAVERLLLEVAPSTPPSGQACSFGRWFGPWLGVRSPWPPLGVFRWLDPSYLGGALTRGGEDPSLVSCEECGAGVGEACRTIRLVGP